MSLRYEPGFVPVFGFAGCDVLTVVVAALRDGAACTVRSGPVIDGSDGAAIRITDVFFFISLFLSMRHRARQA